MKQISQNCSWRFGRGKKIKEEEERRTISLMSNLLKKIYRSVPLTNDAAFIKMIIYDF